MTDEETLAVEMADALFAPSQVGETDYACRWCGTTELGCPILVCACGCEAVMERICPVCRWTMQAVRRQ